MRLFVIAAALAAFAAPVAAQIGNPGGMTASTPESAPGQPAPGQPNAQDRLFYYLAGTGGIAEVSSGRLAEKKAQHPAVKDFARRMVQDHARAHEQLKPLANAARVPLPTGLDPDNKAEAAQLDKLSGAAFDLAYMRDQLVDHQKTVTILQWEISNGQDGELQRYAMKTLPIVMEHMELAQMILADLTGAGPQGLAASSSGQVASAAGVDRTRSRAGR